jgi:hypothetical protein
VAINKKSNMGEITLAGCLFLGIGIGLIFNQVGAGTLIGIGFGLVAMAIIKRRS